MGIPPIRRGFNLGDIADATLRGRVGEIVTERDQLAARVQQLEPLEREVQAARGDAETAKAQNLALTRTNTDLKTQLDRRTADVAARDAELTTLRASEAEGRRAIGERDQLRTRVGQLADTLRERDDAIAKHLAEIERLKVPAAGGGTLLPIASVATNVADQVASAQSAIRARGGLALANISVRLKGVAEGDGSKVRILGASDLRGGALAGSLDEFAFDFAATPAPPTTPAGAVSVPDVLGLTQLAAQRALAAVGLRLDVALGKAPAASKSATGQAFKQAPEAGAGADRGTAVLVVFAQ